MRTVFDTLGVVCPCFVRVKIVKCFISCMCVCFVSCAEDTEVLWPLLSRVLVM